MQHLSQGLRWRMPVEKKKRGSALLRWSGQALPGQHVFRQCRRIGDTELAEWRHGNGPPLAGAATADVRRHGRDAVLALVSGCHLGKSRADPFWSRAWHAMQPFAA